MPAYLVTLNPEISGHTLVEGVNAMVVFAEDTDAAKEICAAKYDFDGDAWADDTTVTAIAQDADFEDWTFSVSVLNGLGAEADESGTVTVTGDDTTNTIDEIAAALVTALNGLTGISGAAYNATSNTLTIASGGGGDDLGDQTVLVEITPPNGKSTIPSLVGTVTHEGAATDALSVVLPADDAVIPTVLAGVKQV